MYQKTATECIFFGECFFGGAQHQHKFKVPRQALNLIDTTQFLSKFPTECSSPCGVAVLGWEARALSDLPPPLGVGEANKPPAGDHRHPVRLFPRGAPRPQCGLRGEAQVPLLPPVGLGWQRGKGDSGAIPRPGWGVRPASSVVPARNPLPPVAGIQFPSGGLKDGRMRN